MTIELKNEHSYDAILLGEAALLPSAAFVVIDDMAFSENGLGRKVAQTMQATISGRDVSVMYMDTDNTAYELVLARDNPVNLGTYAEICANNKTLHDELLMAFGGAGAFTIHEMVTAIAHVSDGDRVTASEAAVWARRQTKRGAWVVSNRYDAVVQAPVNWASVGL